MIHVEGRNGESITLDGAYISKFRHHGKEETARNLATTYRGATVKPKKRKRDDLQEFDVIIACSSLMSLTIIETDRPALDELVAELERTTST